MRTFKYSGNGASKQFLSDVKGMIVTTKGTSHAVSAAKTLAGWQAIINPSTTAAITGTYINLARGLEPKSTAPEFTTANTGFVEKTKDFAPMFEGYGFMSYDDYKTWFAADAQEYDFTLVLDNGDLMTPLTSAGLQKGFKGRMFITFDLPKAGGDGKQKACPFNVMFDDVEEIKEYEILKTAFTRDELEGIVPVGINIEVTTAYESSGGTVVLKATKRATGSPYAGFTAYTQWEVVSVSTDAGGAATAIDATMAAVGIYTLTFLNGAAKLTGDFEVQAVKIDSSHVTYLSNVLNIPV